MKRIVLFKPTLLCRLSMFGVFVMFSLQVQAQTTVFIDFGGTETPGWNNMDAAKGDTIPDLLTSTGASTGIELIIHDAFNGTNTNGTQTADPALEIPGTASGDSFFGNTAEFAGFTEPTGGVTFSNLTVGTPHTFTIFGSRAASDNRETQYEVVGMSSMTQTIQASDNTSEAAVITMMPAADGTITVTASPGANNDHALGFYYMGAIKVSYGSSGGVGGDLVDDFEDPNNTLEWVAFANGHFGDSTFAIVANPVMDAVNSSANVRNWQKAMDAQSFAGERTDLVGKKVAFTGSEHHICTKVLFDHIGSFRVKMESPLNGGPVLSIKVENTKMGEWEEICLDFSNDDTGQNGIGYEYGRITLMFDHGATLTMDENFYFDDLIAPLEDIVVMAEPVGPLIDDFEDPNNTLTFNAFGNGAFGDSTFAIVANPFMDAVNGSANVRNWQKATGAQSFAGEYTDFQATNGFIEFTADDHHICVKVLYDHIGNFRIKMENPIDGGPGLSIKVPNTKVGEWEEICLDFSNDDSGNSGVGFKYERLTFMFDHGEVPTEDQNYYFDDVRIGSPAVGPPPFMPGGEIVYDWETPETSGIPTTFSNGHFGDSTFMSIANPNANGINTSANIYEWCKAADGDPWAGFYFDPIEPFDFTGINATICLNVLMDHVGTVRGKLEQPSSGENVSVTHNTDYVTPNQWQQVCFDYTVPDANDEVGTGEIWSRFTVFFDFGAITDDYCYHFDDLVKFEGGFVQPVGDVIDWETTETSADILGSFGNGHFGTDEFSSIPNPNASGDNTSATVYEWCKANDALDFAAGFAIGIDTIDFTGTEALICISMLADSETLLRLQVEGSETGPDTRLEKTYDSPGEWQQLCFDFTKDGVDGNNASGAIYKRIKLFPSFGTVPSSDECYQFDDLFLVTNGTGEVRKTIGELIMESPDHTKMTELLNTGDIWSAVNAEGITVFAPTDAAFAAMNTAELDAWTNNTNNKLFDGLLHHVILSEVATADLTMGSIFLAGNGQDATVTAGNSEVDGATISEGDIDASNGWLHIVSNVMTLPGNPNDGYLFMDNETDETTLAWTWTPVTIVPNPAPGGINTSATVANFIKTPDGPWWQGSVTESRRVLNFRNGVTEVCVDMLADHPAKIRFKMERPLTPLPEAGGSPATYITFENEMQSVANEWTQVCADIAVGTYRDGAGETHNLEGATHMFSKPVFFLDYIDAPLPTDTVHYFIDNFITKTMTTSTNDLDRLENFTMFPNPTASTIIINTDTPVSRAIIFNTAGLRMMDISNPLGKQINVASLPAGLYFIGMQGTDGNYIGTSKFMKNN